MITWVFLYNFLLAASLLPKSKPEFITNEWVVSRTFLFILFCA